ncbi:unnamed protein product [Mesocestoides corti]|uniref:PLAT domain-containing protein n=1 Tax=Mesocestoides corti TaxID=53468 RepID=A0A158QU56_MESCO|nr:unnamed protein product [Mesocestoides corti]
MENELYHSQFNVPLVYEDKATSYAAHSKAGGPNRNNGIRNANPNNVVDQYAYVKHISIRLKGDKGKSSRISLNNGSKNPTLERGSMREFQIECKDNGGAGPDDGLLLSSVQITHPETSRAWLFPIRKWLSHFDGERLATRDFKGVRTVLTDYQITAVTGDMDGAGTDSRVFLVMCGERGESPPFELTSPDRHGLFDRGAVSRFNIRTYNLGDLLHIRVSRDSSGTMKGWYLKRVIVEDPLQPQCCYMFNCNDWISLPKTNRTNSTHVIKSEASTAKKNCEYRVSFHIANARGTGTTSDVFMRLYGRDGVDNERWFNSHASQFAVDGAVVRFSFLANKRLGDLIKAKVGLNGKGDSPGLLLDKVVVEDVSTKEVFTFPCGQWLIPHRIGATVSQHLFSDKSSSRSFSPIAPTQHFEMMISSKSENTQGVPTDIYFRLLGPKVRHFDESAFNNSIRSGNFQSPHKSVSPIICIPGSQIRLGDTTFFTFNVDGCGRLSPSSKLALGHGSASGAADWLVEKVLLKCLNTGITQIFCCNKWFPFANDVPKAKEIGPVYTVMPPKTNAAISNANWKVEFYTGKLAGSSASARFYLTLYGDQGKTDEILLNEYDSSGNNNYNNMNLAQNSCKSFKLNMPPIGVPHKVRIRLDDPGHSLSWHLERVILQNLLTGKNYSFACNKWITSEDSSGSLVCELPARGPDITQPASVKQYKVNVHTGELSSEHFDGHVYINLFGDIGDTGKRRLNTRNTGGTFSKGKVDEFVIEAVDIGKLEKIRIGHDGRDSDPAWFLDRVTVEEVGNSTNTAEFVMGGYTVRTKTGEHLGAGTKADVFLAVEGDDSKTPLMQLKHTQANNGRFRIGQIDTFSLEGPFVGKIQRAKIWIDSKDDVVSWYLKDFSITVNEVSLRYLFNADRWLTKVETDRSKEFEFTPSSVERLFSAVPYEITFYTGTGERSGTDALVYLQLFGSKGAKKTEMLLFKSEGRVFGTAGVDTFNVYTGEVGELTKIRVGHNGTGEDSNWYLEKIRIRKVSTHACSCCHGEVCPNLRKLPTITTGVVRTCEDSRCDCRLVPTRKVGDLSPLKLEDRALDDYWFYARRWLPPTEKENDQAFCELLPTSIEGKPLTTATPTAYQVRVRTGNASGSGTSARVYLTLIGEGSESGEFCFPNSTGSIFSKGSEAVFQVEAVDLGKLTRIRIRHDNSGSSPSWYLQDVTVCETEPEDGRDYYFPCETWLTATADGTGRLVREFSPSPLGGPPSEAKVRPIQDYVRENSLVAEKNYFSKSEPVRDYVKEPTLSKPDLPIIPPPEFKTDRRSANPAQKSYAVSIKTGENPVAGTSSNVYIKLFGASGETEKIPLKAASVEFANASANRFQAGNKDTFLVQIPEIGDLKGIRLGHDSSGVAPSWYVENVRVESKATGAVLQFPCNRWIEKSGNRGEAYVDLAPKLPSLGLHQPRIFYEFKVFTSDIEGAGTNANVFVELTGPEGRKTSQVELKGVFRQGGCEILCVELEDIGEPLRSLRIGHNNAGLSPDWHLDRVEVRPMNSKLPQDEVYIFKFNQWLSGTGGTGTVLYSTTGRPQACPPSSPEGAATYEISVTTGALPNAGTTAKVYLTLIDWNGSEEERLLFPTKDGTTPFRPGQTDVFMWKNVSLKGIRKIQLRHDNTGTSPNLFVNKVVVKEIPPFGNQPIVHTFDCNRWINSNGEEFNLRAPRRSTTSPLPPDDAIKLEIPQGKKTSLAKPSLDSLPPPQQRTNDGAVESPGVHLISPPQLPQPDDGEGKSKLPYKITLATGNEVDAGTQGPVLMNLVGPNGTSTGWLFFQTQAGNTALNAGSIKTFVFSAPALSEVTAIEIYNQAGETAQTGWHLNHLCVEIPSNELVYEIPCNIWVTCKKGTRRAYHRLIITPSHLSKRGLSGTSSKACYSLKIWLNGRVPQNVGDSVFLQVTGKKGASIDGMINYHDWTLHNRLLTFHFLVPDDIGALAGLKVRFSGGKSHEIDQFTLENLPYLGGLTGCRLWHDNRMPAAAWLCEWINIEGVLKEGSRLLPQTWYFPCNRWLRGDGRSLVAPLDLLPLDVSAAPALVNPAFNIDSSKGGSVMTVDPPKETEKADYIIEVETGNANEAGTELVGWIVIKGRTGISPVFRLTHPDGSPVLKTGHKDTFRVNCEYLGVLQQIYVGLYDPSGHFREDELEPKYVNLQYNRSNQWNCKLIEVTDSRSGEKYLFNINQWILASSRLDRREGVSARPAELRNTRQDNLKHMKEFFIQNETQTVTYRVSIETGNINNAGTTANVYIVLFGSQEGLTSGLQSLVKLSNETFTRGRKDVFFIACENLGNVKRIRIEHDNSGSSPDWFIEKITVQDTSSGHSWIFPFQNWLSLTQGSKSLRQELTAS